MFNKYNFKPGWASSVSVVALVPLFVALGFWQLRRAEEKESLMALQLDRSRQPVWAIDRSDQPLEPMRYRAVRVSGTYDAAHQFLLDNQVHQGRAGYHVLTPFKLRGLNGVAVLINRGWVPSDGDRTRVPDVAVAEGDTQLQGVAEQFQSVAWRLAGAELPAPGWPGLIQWVEPGVLSERLGYRLLPYQVLLSPAEPDGYARDWKPASLDPGRNRGYALQWFSFAVVLLALYGWYGSPRGRGVRSSDTAPGGL